MVKAKATREDSAQLGFVGERIGYLLHRANLMHMQLIRHHLARIGLTPARATALVFANENPGCRQNSLGKALNINRASAMELVDELVALNAVERRAATDRRANALFVTAPGKRLVSRFLAISNEVDEVIAGSLPPAERKLLIDLFARIADSLKIAIDEASAPVAKPKPKQKRTATR